MVSTQRKNKVLVIGALEHMGKHIAIASVKLGYPTFVLLTSFHSADRTENEIIQLFREQGVTRFQLTLGVKSTDTVTICNCLTSVLFDAACPPKGDIYNHKSLVQAIRAVDVVISAVRGRLVPEQTRIIEAIKEAGKIKRFIPSGTAIDVDRVHLLQPAQNVYDRHCKIRRSIERSNIPYTYIVESLCAEQYFGPMKREQPIINRLFGDGNTKVVFSLEKDIGLYTILAANDTETLNKTVYIMPPDNVLSLNEIVSLWESKTGRRHNRDYFSEEAVLKRYHEEGSPEEMVQLAYIHAVFIKGEQTKVEIQPAHGVEATELYPNVTYTRMSDHLGTLLQP